jgi:hypothetical protein
MPQLVVQWFAMRPIFAAMNGKKGIAVILSWLIQASLIHRGLPLARRRVDTLKKGSFTSAKWAGR